MIKREALVAVKSVALGFGLFGQQFRLGFSLLFRQRGFRVLATAAIVSTFVGIYGMCTTPKVKADGPTVTVDGYTMHSADWITTVGRGNQYDTMYAATGDEIIYRLHVSGRGENKTVKVVWGQFFTRVDWFEVGPNPGRWIVQERTERSLSFNLVSLRGNAEIIMYMEVGFPEAGGSSNIMASTPGWEDTIVVHSLDQAPRLWVNVNPATAVPGGTITVLAAWERAFFLQVCVRPWQQPEQEWCLEPRTINVSERSRGQTGFYGVETPHTDIREVRVRAWGLSGGYVETPWIRIYPPGVTVT